MHLEKLSPKEDDRGMFVETFKEPGQVSYIYTDPGYTRGNHYHLRKIEKFVVIGGIMEMVVKDRDTGNIMKVIASSGDPMVITIHPNHTHMIQALDVPALCLVWSSEAYDPNDADTYPEEI